MREFIIEKLNEIEQRHGVRILHAVESGSRAWGFPSPDSDFDVRFIYVRPKEDYLRLNTVRDVIEEPISDLLDINGWDLKKALQLLHSANPTLFEWMNSPIVYKESGFSDKLRPLLDRYFSSRKGLYHYISMAEGNYREYLKGEMVRAKKYFYVLRPILACKWILEHHTPPPMQFRDLMDAQLELALKPAVERLLDLKINHPETKEIPRVDVINRYIEENIPAIKEQIALLPKEVLPDWAPLDELFLHVLNV